MIIEIIHEEFNNAMLNLINCMICWSTEFNRTIIKSGILINSTQILRRKELLSYCDLVCLNKLDKPHIFIFIIWPHCIFDLERKNG